MRKFLIGAAALALAASGAWADPGGGGHGGGGHGGGGGNGGGGGHGPEMKADRGPSMKADRGPSMKADHGPSMKADRGPSMREAKVDRGSAMREAGNDRGHAMREVRADHGPAMKAERHAEHAEAVAVRRSAERIEERGRNSSDWNGRDTVRRVAFGDDRRGLIDGCPPGLAKKNNGCMPPGLARERDSVRNAYYDPAFFGYRSLGDGRYYVDNGYLYRTDRSGSVLGYLPLLGGALSPGNVWPSYYQPVSVPDYYVDYYNLGPANGYRYADNVLYRVDPQTSTINSIAALLTGDQWAVGQPMPPGYDVYNVPYAYQDRYIDSPDSLYRYSDGYVYQVDPTTQLVEAVIQLLT